ncbi:MAG: hypothetical protein M3Q30_09605 [Actinomycetota bacterium]|nr:hypothetical protein [Actinomycetota bacterium]
MQQRVAPGSTSNVSSRPDPLRHDEVATGVLGRDRIRHRPDLPRNQCLPRGAGTIYERRIRRSPEDLDYAQPVGGALEGGEIVAHPMAEEPHPNAATCREVQGSPHPVLGRFQGELA